MSIQKRLRIFSGPNGSGKSTIIDIVKKQGIDMGVYVNADDIKKGFEENGFIHLDLFGISAKEDEFKNALLISTFFEEEIRFELANCLSVESEKLSCNNTKLFDFLSTFTADYLRNKLLENCPKFTFETVMSHPSKLEFIQKAHNAGYRTYLYFVSLEDPELNKQRVKARVALNGHDVPADKIESRYYKTMSLLFEAMKLVDKAYFFDNSGSKSVFFAEYSNAEIEIMEPDNVPQWFYTYVLDKIEVS